MDVAVNGGSELSESKEQFETALKRMSKKYDDVCQDYDRSLISKHVELTKEKADHAATRAKMEKLRAEKGELEERLDRLETENRKLRLGQLTSSSGTKVVAPTPQILNKNQRNRPSTSHTKLAPPAKRNRRSPSKSPELNSSPPPKAKRPRSVRVSSRRDSLSSGSSSNESNNEPHRESSSRPGVSKIPAPPAPPALSSTAQNTSAYQHYMGYRGTPVKNTPSTSVTTRKRPVTAGGTRNRSSSKKDPSTCPKCGKRMNTGSVLRHLAQSCPMNKNANFESALNVDQPETESPGTASGSD